jgi:hypothetical protein
MIKGWAEPEMHQDPDPKADMMRIQIRIRTNGMWFVRIWNRALDIIFFMSPYKKKTKKKINMYPNQEVTEI